jgi:hypothetical protein
MRGSHGHRSRLYKTLVPLANFNSLFAFERFFWPIFHGAWLLGKWPRLVGVETGYGRVGLHGDISSYGATILAGFKQSGHNGTMRGVQKNK